MQVESVVSFEIFSQIFKEITLNHWSLKLVKIAIIYIITYLPSQLSLTISDTLQVNHPPIIHILIQFALPRYWASFIWSWLNKAIGISGKSAEIRTDHEKKKLQIYIFHNYYNFLINI